MKIKAFWPWDRWYYLMSLGIPLVKCQTNQTLRPFIILIEQESLVKFRKFKPQDGDVDPQTKTEDDSNYVDRGPLSPITYVPHLVTGSIVSDSKDVPKGYISKDGNDIGAKVENDDWTAFLTTQTGLKVLIPILFFLFLLVPIIGLIYACCCTRCKKTRRSSKCTRYCCGILLAILAFLMILFLILAILAATRLNKNLKSLKSSECLRRNSIKSKKGIAFKAVSDHMHHLYVVNYNELVKRIQDAMTDEPSIKELYSEGEDHAKAIEKLIEVLQNMPQAKPLMAKVNDEIPNIRPLATQFRDALRGAKRDLIMFLTSKCNQRECQDFYRQHDIGMLDMGCLHYDELPKLEIYMDAIQEVVDSNFIKYPQKAAQQLRQISNATKDHMSNIISDIKDNLDRSAQELQKRYAASLEVLRQVVKAINKDESYVDKEKVRPTSTPAAALRRKLGPTWLGTTLFIIVLLMLVPLFLILALLVALSNPKVASRLLCAVLISIFLLFSVAMIPVLFNLIHGALMYQAFCLRKPTLPVVNKFINPNEYIPKNLTIFRSLPMLRTADILQSCVYNDSLFNVLGLEELYNLEGLRDDVMKDVDKTLEKKDNASLPHQLIHPEAEKMATELLQGNISRYDSKLLKKDLCPELVPEPKPGRLPALTTELDNLANAVKPGVTLQNQAIHLRAYQKYLGEPLETIIQQLLDMLKEIDRLLSGSYGSFAKYMEHLLSKIEQGDDFLQNYPNNKMGEVSRNISSLVETGLDEYIRMVDKATHGEMESCEPLTREEDQAMVEYTELCNRFVRPMNAIWLWLLMFSLLLLPAICCIHFLRCRLKSLRNLSEATLVSVGEGNFVAPGMLPVGLPQCYCYRYLPVAAETNVDHMDMDEDFYVDLVKRKRE
ncbi:prominin-like protein [Drosophila eugracilis]|uniref:prominin-like protein n=1 Tax=Drosophila eugracilis TaxID=29029 RepID=UPI001BDA38AA|nr:prominin-like protein [Drosophila eugracilis]